MGTLSSAAWSGAFYFIDLCLGWHVGFIGKHNMNKKLVMDGRAVAWFYVWHGQFLVDIITAIAWITQARVHCLACSKKSEPQAPSRLRPSSVR